MVVRHALTPGIGDNRSLHIKKYQKVCNVLAIMHLSVDTKDEYKLANNRIRLFLLLYQRIVIALGCISKLIHTDVILFRFRIFLVFNYIENRYS